AGNCASNPDGAAQPPSAAAEEARERAVLLLSRTVGAMVLARAVRRVEPELSDKILRICKAHALD
ncbi:hypothetical protein ACPCAL_29265, partial [Streptomyces cellulosae]